MEVGVIYQSESIIDENNNFKIEFRNEQEIVELLFKENRDFYLANAIAFVKNKFDKDIIELEEKVHKAETSFPFPPQIEIDYSNQFLLDKILNKYAYVLDDTTNNYLKQITYFDIESEVVKKKNIYDVIQRLTDGISYSNKATNIQDLYTKIEFKLTPARKIEIKLTDSANKNILYHYYEAINGIFVRNPKRWVKADIGWFRTAQSIFSSLLKKNASRWQANIQTLKFIWNYYKNRPNSQVLSNGYNYNPYKQNVIIFYGLASDSNSRYYHINFQKALNGPYDVYVSPDFNWYKKRSYNIFRFFSFEGIIDNPFEPIGPLKKLAKFNNRNRTGSNNEDFTQGWTMPTDKDIEKKLIGNDILQTDSFSGKEKQKDLTPSALDKYKLDNLKISGNDFTDLNKTIKPTEFAFFFV